MNNFYVYLDKRPDGTPFYVGKGTGRRARKLIRRNNPYHNNIVAKYGKENIIIEIVKDGMPESEAFDMEIYLISSLKESGFRLCNMSSGGEGPSNPSEETRRRMSIAQSKRTYPPEVRENMRRAQLGRKHPDEVKAKIGAGNKGKVLSEETKKKLHDANVGKIQSVDAREKNRQAQIGNKHALGNKFSKEVKIYLSSIRKGVPWSEARRLAQPKRYKKRGDIQNARC